MDKREAEGHRERQREGEREREGERGRERERERERERNGTCVVLIQRDMNRFTATARQRTDKASSSESIKGFRFEGLDPDKASPSQSA